MRSQSILENIWTSYPGELVQPALCIEAIKDVISYFGPVDS